MIQTKFKRQDDIPKPVVEMKMGQRNVPNTVTTTSTRSSTKYPSPAGFRAFPADIPLAVLNQPETIGIDQQERHKEVQSTRR